MSKAAHKSPNPAHARKKSRRLAMQALYQWTMSGDNLNDIELQFQQKEEIRQQLQLEMREIFSGRNLSG